MNIAQVLSKRLPEIPCMEDQARPLAHSSVGIEYEIENLSEIPPGLKRWSVSHNEGSVINGVELISDPVWGTAITDALDELQSVICDQPVRASFRTSVHVHSNVLDIDANVLDRLFKIYLLYEPAIFRLPFNNGRQNNVFCVPAQISGQIQTHYRQLTSSLGTTRGLSTLGSRLNGDLTQLESKYAALNPNSIRNFGTIEFRHMRGTTSVRDISDWVDIILQLKKAAIMDVDMYNPEAVWEKFAPDLTLTPEELEHGTYLINLYEAL